MYELKNQALENYRGLNIENATNRLDFILKVVPFMNTTNCNTI